MQTAIISDTLVPHPITFNTGPRIERVQIVEVNGKRFTINFWYQNGKLLRVDSIAQ